MDWDKISAELQKPLNSAHVKPPKQFGPKGSYIEAWHAQAEANRIFGEGGWLQEVMETKCVSEKSREIGQQKKPGFGVTYIAKVRITVDGVAREDFGAGHGYDVDLGLAHESAIKEAVSDAMKRALKSFGNPFGLALYDKTQANVADTAQIEAAEAKQAEAAAKTKAFVDGIVSQIETETPEGAAVILQENDAKLAWVKGKFPDEFRRVEDAAKAAGAPMREVA